MWLFFSKVIQRHYLIFNYYRNKNNQIVKCIYDIVNSTSLFNISLFVNSYISLILSWNSRFISLEKPMFITELKRETLSDYGSTVTLPCDANGVPPPTISWFRNAESVDYLLGTRYAQIFILIIIIGSRKKETEL